MKRTWLPSLGLIAALSAGSAAAGAFSPGERATYQVRFLGMPAGEARIEVRAPTQQWGTEVWPIVTDARSDSMVSFFFSVRDHFVTYWDYANARSIGSRLDAREGDRHWGQLIQLDHEARQADVLKTKAGEPPKQTRQEISSNTTEVGGAAFAFRNAPLEVGGVYSVPVFTGNKSFNLKATVVSRERIQTPWGRREVFKVKAETAFTGKLASKRALYVYFTTDPSHVPVRIEADFAVGRIVAELTSYRPGSEVAANDAPASEARVSAAP